LYKLTSKTIIFRFAVFVEEDYESRTCWNNMSIYFYFKLRF
jgi:hypothetical protein